MDALAAFSSPEPARCCSCRTPASDPDGYAQAMREVPWSGWACA